MTIHQEKDDWWLRINLEDVEGSTLKVKNLVPHNLTVDTSQIMLKVDKKFYHEKFKTLEKLLLIDDVKYISKMKKSYENCPVVHDSLAWNNFQVNRKYN